jgi:hypothetical protein
MMLRTYGRHKREWAAEESTMYDFLLMDTSIAR